MAHLLTFLRIRLPSLEFLLRLPQRILGYGQEDREIVALLLGEARSYYFLQHTCIQTCSRPNRSPVQRKAVVKRTQCDTNHSPPHNFEVKNEWSANIIPPPRYVFIPRGQLYRLLLPQPKVSAWHRVIEFQRCPLYFLFPFSHVHDNKIIYITLRFLLSLFSQYVW